MSLIHWWPLNGDTKDYGTENKELANGSATVDNSGKIGKCYSFNGNNSYLRANAPVGALCQNISFSFWINPNSVANNFTVLSSRKSTGYGLSIFYIADYGFRFDNGNDYTVPSQWQSTVILEPSQWTHIIIIQNDTKRLIYKNGVLAQSVDMTGTNTCTAQYILLGASSANDSTPTGNYLNGKLNDIRIYDYALSVKEIKEISKGLVLYYNFEDPYVEGTTNTHAYTGDIPHWSINTFYNGATGVYGYGENSNCMYYYVNMPDKNGNLKKMVKVNTLTNGVTAAPYIWIDYVNPSLNKYITVSFDYFTTCSTTAIYPYSFRDNYRCSYWDSDSSSWKGGTSTEVGISITPNKWNHIVYRFTKIDETYGSGPGYVRVGTTNSTSDYWLFDNIQVEAKDHATPYVNGTRPDSPIFDNSGYGNNGTINGNLQISTNTGTGKYSSIFNGDDNSVQTPNLANLIHDGVFTITQWFLHTDEYSSKGYETLYGGPSGFEIESKLSSSNVPIFVAYNWGGSTSEAQRFTYTLNKWHQYAMVRTTEGTVWYMDGVQIFTGAAGSIPSGDYFIGAWKTAVQQNFKGKIADFKIYSTALSAEDIKAEYTRKASIDRNGNLFTGEVNEENTVVSVTKKNQVQTYSFKEGLDIAKFFGGYTQLAYIECNGAQYINTEYIPNYNTAIEGSFSHNEHVIDTPLFGVRTANYNSSYTMWAHPLEYSSSGKNTMIFNDYQKTFSIGINEGLIENFYYSNNLMINNTERFTYTVSSGSPNLPLILLGLSNGGNIDSRKFLGKLYTFKIYDNGALVRDFIPAKRNKDNVLGLYDLVEHKFYTNQGTGTFTGGTELGPLSAIALNEIKEN